MSWINSIDWNLVYKIGMYLGMFWISLDLGNILWELRGLKASAQDINETLRKIEKKVRG